VLGGLRQVCWVLVMEGESWVDGDFDSVGCGSLPRSLDWLLLGDPWWTFFVVGVGLPFPYFLVITLLLV
jgi:hypothetical protein